MVVHMHGGRFSSRPETIKPAFMHMITHKNTHPTANVYVCVNRDDVTILHYLIIVLPEKHRSSLAPASASSTNTSLDLLCSNSATLMSCQLQPHVDKEIFFVIRAACCAIV